MTIEAIFKINKVINVEDLEQLPQVLPTPVTIRNENVTEASISVEENTCYVFTQPLTSLIISSVENSALPSKVVFKVAQGAEVSFSTLSDVIGNKTFEANKEYVLFIQLNTIFIYEKN